MTDALDILAKRGLDVEVCDRLGIRPCDPPSWVEGGQNRTDWISIEYPGRQKLRTMREPKLFTMTKGPPVSAWNRDVIADQTLADQPLVITEGELDAVAAIQCGWVRSVSHPTGAPSKDEPFDSDRYAWLQTEREHLKSVREIILATDSDGPGQMLRDQLAIRLGKARCRWLQYPKACKDLGDTLRLYKQEGVEAAVARAQWLPVAGVCRWTQLPPAPSPPAWDLPLLRSVWRPRPGDFTVITGIPGHGKSLFINWTIVELARHYGLKIALASFELADSDAKEIFRGLAHQAPADDLSTYTLRQIDQWLDERLLLMMPPDGGEATLEWLWECLETAVMRHDCRMVVIDPFNEIEHLRRRDETETEYIGRVIRMLRHFGRRFETHVVVIAHPAKSRDPDGGNYPPDLSSISGSAHWCNKPDVGLTVWRDQQNLTTIINRKARYEGKCGKFGESVKLRWNTAKMTFEGT